MTDNSGSFGAGHVVSLEADEIQRRLVELAPFAQAGAELGRRFRAGEITCKGKNLGQYILGDLLPVEDARARLLAELQSFEATVVRYYRDCGGLDSAPRLGLAPATGVGKTTEAINMVARLIDLGALGGRKPIFAVPNHELGEEIAAKFRAKGVRAEVWRGREADNLAAPGEKMCLRPDEVRATIAGGYPVSENCCFNTATKVECPQYKTCPFQLQKIKADEAQVMIVSHIQLFHEKPNFGKGKSGEAGILIIDEGFWQVGINTEYKIQVGSLDPTFVLCNSKGVGGESWQTDPEATEFLKDAHDRLVRALIGAPLDKPVSVASLKQAELTEELCREAASLQRRRYTNSGISPKTELEERIDRITKTRAKNCLHETPAQLLFEALATALREDRDAGNVIVGRVPTGHDIKELRVRKRTPIRAGWTENTDGPVPVLALDATMRPELVRPYFRFMRFAEPIRVAMPHVRINQFLNVPQTLGKLGLSSDLVLESDEVKKEFLDLWRFVRARATRVSGTMLVVGQKAVIEKLKSLDLPANVETTHFGRVQGLDKWGKVEYLIIIGRTQARSGEIERYASALANGITFGPINPPEVTASGKTTPGYYKLPQGVGLVINPKGVCKQVRASYYPEGLPENIRASICDDQIVQALGRPRGVNRTAANPLTIDLLTEVPLELPVDVDVEWGSQGILTSHGLAFTAAEHNEVTVANIEAIAQTAEASTGEVETRRFRLRGHSHINFYEVKIDRAVYPDPVRTLTAAFGQDIELEPKSGRITVAIKRAIRYYEDKGVAASRTLLLRRLKDNSSIKADEANEALAQMSEAGEILERRGDRTDGKAGSAFERGPSWQDA